MARIIRAARRARVCATYRQNKRGKTVCSKWEKQKRVKKPYVRSQKTTDNMAARTAARELNATLRDAERAAARADRHQATLKRCEDRCLSAAAARMVHKPRAKRKSKTPVNSKFN